MKSWQQNWNNAKETVAKNFWHATLNFVFILIFVNVFQKVFGMENSIVGVIFTIMMSASMVRDLTATPIRHLCLQTAILFVMATAACFVLNAPPLIALGINFAVIFLILYAFTYEYVSHLYFPYILSYLFLVFISPVTPQELPKRLLGVFTGAVCIILYQLVTGRKRVVETTHDVLISMIDRADGYITHLLSGKEVVKEPEQLRADLCKLSKMVYDRRKRALCISDASFAMIDSGRGLENLVLLLYEIEGPMTEQRRNLLQQVSSTLKSFREFMSKNANDIPSLRQDGFLVSGNAEAEQVYRCLDYIRNHMMKMTSPEKRVHYPKSVLSLSVRLKAALHVSPVRVVYALRTSCLLAACTLFVQLLGLPHGKWLLFTVASVSLPYADDVCPKAKKRIMATLIGGLCSVVIFSLVTSATGRTLVMMLSGYLSFYFSDYQSTFACSTVGALGGAIFMETFSWGPVGYMSIVRLEYIVIGVLVALAVNCLILPFKRATATRQLWRKYASTTELLSKICRDPEIDSQLYYALVIQAHLQEDKLKQNAKALNWEGVDDLLEERRQAVRNAHRTRPALGTSF